MSKSCRWIAPIFITVFFSISALATPVAIIPGTVVSIVDGDTVHISTGPEYKDLKIRMIGIDTAELHLPVPGGMASQGYWAEQGSAKLAELVPIGAEVLLHSFGTDKYGRILGRILVDGIDVNLEMVRSGWAAVYEICSGSDCDSKFFDRHNVRAYLAACSEAVAARRGFFDVMNPIPELPFEFRLRMQKREPDKFVGDFLTRKLVKPAQYARIPICRRIFFKTEAEAKRLGFGY